MAHKLLRLTEKYLNTPHLIEPKTANTLFGYLENRNLENIQPEMLRFGAEHHGASAASQENGVYMIDVDGPLTYKSTGWEAFCGGMSYEALSEHVDMALSDPRTKTILLAVDSGGGEAYGMMETANNIRRKADEKGVKVIAYVDGMSASAAYGLSVAAHEIIVNPEAEVGSIGVVVKLQNNAEAKKKAGISDTYVYAGDNKIPFDAEGNFREGFLEDIQSKVDMLYGKFVSHVADARGLSEDSVKATQAGVFSANKALELGLVDSIMEREEFFEYLADLQEDGNMKFSKSLFKEKDTTEMSEVSTEAFAELEAKMADMQAAMEKQAAVLAAVEAEKAALENEKVEAAKAELGAKVAEFSFVGDAAEMTEALFAMGEGSEKFLSAFAAAAGEIEAAKAEAEAAKKKASDDELEEMCTQASVEGEGETLSEAEQRVKSINAKLGIA